MALWRRGVRTLLLTLLLIVLLPIDTGMVLGIALAFAHGLLVVARPGLVRLARQPGSRAWTRSDPKQEGEQVAGVVVVLISAPLHFTNAHDLSARLQAAVTQSPTPVRALVIDASSIIDIDYTASCTVQELSARLDRRGCRLLIAGLIAPRAVTAAQATGLVAALGQERFFATVETAVDAAEAMENAGAAESRARIPV